ncbi:hypothetical protein B0J12DRAFT_570315 [Macrophomina phaseolina]|uniref:Thioredoxin-like fold domain-containing protein n=1 Tax=Macrophomina phaseolina TaxID=35725 RepID=A0ABQ8GGP2_9PEZI|nr:hypothetical protein B0J12DRAFT_570315 [Macrophomina phaseolina]
MSAQSRITVFRGWDCPGNYVWPPFVTKIELRLRITGVSYRAASGSTQVAPRGKIPYISLDGSDPVSDSTLIVDKLTEEGVVPDINAALTPAQRAHDLALRAMLEDKLYFYHSYERWLTDDNVYTMRDHVLNAAPYPVRVVVGLLIHRGVKQALHGQGTSRLSPEEIAAFRLQIWKAFEALLVEAKRKQGAGDAPFWVLGGESPSEADMLLFAFTASVLVCTACVTLMQEHRGNSADLFDGAPDSQKVVRGLPAIMEYAHRIHGRYFPDYKRWA